MNNCEDGGRSHRAYSIEPRDRFFDATRAIVGYEIKPGNTMTFLVEVDLSEVEMLRARAKAEGSPKPSYTTFVVKATALALKAHPHANRRVVPNWIMDRFRRARLQKFHHMDVSVACERWMSESTSCAFIDNLRDADRLSLDEITGWLRRLAQSDENNNQQWRSFKGLIGKLPTWLSTILIRMPLFLPGYWVKYRGAAALISSPAKYGVDGVAGSWASPLGISFGFVKPRPVVVDGKVVARPTFTLSLNFDRRVMAGAQAAKFLRSMVVALENASKEMAPFLPKSNPVDDEQQDVNVLTAVESSVAV